MAQNEIILTIFGQKRANFSMAKNQKFQLQQARIAMVRRSRLPSVFIAKNGQNTDLNHQNVEFGDP